MTRFIIKKSNEEKGAYLEWLNGTIDKLISLEEPEGYTEEVERCIDTDSKDYYIGLYQGIIALASAIDKSLYDDKEELAGLVADTQNENIRHYVKYE